MSTPLQNQIAELVSQLSPKQQHDVLQFVQSLRSDRSKAERNRVLEELAGSIPPDDIAIMKRVIEEECGQVNPDAW